MNKTLLAGAFGALLFPTHSIFAGEANAPRQEITEQVSEKQSDPGFQQDATEKYSQMRNEIAKLKLSMKDRKAWHLVELGKERLFSKNDVKGATKYFHEAENLSPDHPGVTIFLAYTLKTVGDLRGAIDVLSRAAQRHPEDRVNYISNRVPIYTQLGMYEEAIRDSEECLKAHPKVATYWWHHARLLIKLKRYHEAAVAFENSVGLSKFNPKSDASICRDLKDHGEASSSCASL
jgi:tetratricopeptide (TPR) repeat protein